MIVGNIDYANMLPFYVFLKKLNYKFYAKKGVPSKINQLFLKRKVDGAMISSIFSKQKRCLKFGIVAKNEVLSVLLIPGKYKQDSESNTSNILAKVLNLQGEIIIGDKALKIKDKTAIDLALKWKEKTNLPFVFARYCFNKNEKIFNKITKEFLKKQTKIPSYILNKYAKKLSISSKELKFYLAKIDYFLGYKEEKSLKLFLKWSKIARN